MPNADDAASIADARDLWEYLTRSAGLQPGGWDRQLAEKLGGTLGLDGPPTGPRLAGAGTSVEALLYAVLEAVEPFAAMIGDLLGLFEQHWSARTDDSAAVAFDFDVSGG